MDQNPAPPPEPAHRLLSKSILFAITILLLTAILIFAGWKYTHPARTLGSVIANRFHRYSEEYIHGYIRGFKHAQFAMEEMIAFVNNDTLGLRTKSAASREIQAKYAEQLEADAKTIDELRGSRDGYHDAIDNIWEKVDSK